MGTAASDLVSERRDLGERPAAVLFALAIGAVAVAHFALGLDAVWSFWIEYGLGPVTLSWTVAILGFVGYLPSPGGMSRALPCLATLIGQAGIKSAEQQRPGLSADGPDVQGLACGLLGQHALVGADVVPAAGADHQGTERTNTAPSIRTSDRLRPARVPRAQEPRRSRRRWPRRRADGRARADEQADRGDQCHASLPLLRGVVVVGGPGCSCPSSRLLVMAGAAQLTGLGRLRERWVGLSRSV